LSLASVTGLVGLLALPNTARWLSASLAAAPMWLGLWRVLRLKPAQKTPEQHAEATNFSHDQQDHEAM
jgi:hypothetical protein